MSKKYIIELDEIEFEYLTFLLSGVANDLLFPKLIPRYIAVKLERVFCDILRKELNKENAINLIKNVGVKSQVCPRLSGAL